MSRLTRNCTGRRSMFQLERLGSDGYCRLCAAMSGAREFDRYTLGRNTDHPEMSKVATALVRVTTLTAALTLLLSLAPTLAAQVPVPEAGAKRTQKILQDFDSRMRRIDSLLLAGDSMKAYRQARLLLQQMTNSFISGPSVGRFLGATTVLRAIAAYNLGREDEALWHWHVATQLFPDVLQLQMTAYGDAGLFLKNHPLPQEKEESGDGSKQGNDIKPPRKKRSPQPQFPVAKRGRGKISVVVQVIIDIDGRVREPRILESRGELTLVSATLDALRKWEFRPAEINGQPVEVYYNLTANF